jgi:hypothetical protein
MDNFAKLLAEKNRLLSELEAIKTGAAEISRLLADEILGGADWDEAVRVLGRCRAQRKRLDDRLVHLAASMALVAHGRDVINVGCTVALRRFDSSRLRALLA